MFSMREKTVFTKNLKLLSRIFLSPMIRSSLAVCLLAAGAEAFGFGTMGLAPAVAPRSSHAAAGGLRMGIDQVEAKLTEKQKGGPYKARYAPVITLFDNPGCPRENKEYKGKKSGDLDDERCVMVRMEKIEWSEVREANLFRPQSRLWWCSTIPLGGWAGRYSLELFDPSCLCRPLSAPCLRSAKRPFVEPDRRRVCR